MKEDGVKDDVNIDVYTTRPWWTEVPPVFDAIDVPPLDVGKPASDYAVTDYEGFSRSLGTGILWKTGATKTK